MSKSTLTLETLPNPEEYEGDDDVITLSCSSLVMKSAGCTARART